MQILPLTPAQIAYKDKHKIEIPKLEDGSTKTVANRILTHLKDGPSRYTDLAYRELQFKWEHPEYIKGDMIPDEISHLNPHFQDQLSRLQILGHINKVLIDGKKCYVLADGKNSENKDTEV